MVGWDFWEVYEFKVFSLTMRWESVCPRPTALLIMVYAWGDFFKNNLLGIFFLAFASPQPPILFPNGEIPKL